MALQSADLGSEGGAPDEIEDLLYSTDKEVGVLFGLEGGGLGDPVPLFAAASGEEITSVAWANLDSDSSGGKLPVPFVDLVVTVAREVAAGGAEAPVKTTTSQRSSPRNPFFFVERASSPVGG